jgi:hypothetical protein
LCGVAYPEYYINPWVLKLFSHTDLPPRKLTWTERRNILLCVIPSYTLQELSLYSGYFGVGLKELAARCFEIGPSFRYIFAANDYAQTKEMTAAKANNISADQMGLYIDNNFFQGADSGDISAGLMKVTVREEEYEEDPDDAYLDRNAIWEIASQHLWKIILSNAKSRLMFEKGKIFDVEYGGQYRSKSAVLKPSSQLLDQKQWH